MLRMYLLQCWCNLSDEGIEDAVYDGYSLRWFMNDERAPDATTLLTFRHLPEKHGIAKRIERRKSSIRSKVEHPFLIIKRFFGYSKTVYRGLAKNAHRLHMLFTSANPLMCIRAGMPLPA
jgi:IS5 family transposase